MSADANAAAPRQDGAGEGEESSAPRRKGLRRGLRNLVAARRQQHEGRAEGEPAADPGIRHDARYRLDAGDHVQQ
ncbi:hypothetical protein, partial [Ralstonia pseudosolanacearum]|uniref:hypothetical protein n=1 Tax=Ralstonia pseudosolanacearum TaxID=1310165 RepID=UPI003221B6D7